jgi:ABC-type transport system involved in multi-copper enzyme maturation permease subunit
MKTLSFAPRNLSHATWLLLLVPPLIGFVIPIETESLPRQMALGLRLALAVFLVLVGVLRTSLTTQRTLKELRLQLPGALIALLGPGVVGWHAFWESTPFAVGFLMLGCLLIGATSFGSEFENRTMGSLLSQPVDRSAVFLEKFAVSGFLILAAYLNLMLTLVPVPEFRFTLKDGLAVGLYALFPLFSGAWLSLISRSTLAGAVFIVAVPGILFGLAFTAIDAVYRILTGHGGLPEATIERFVGAGFSSYFVVALALGWRSFARLEVREGGAGGRSTSGMHPLSRPLDDLLARLLPTGSSTAQLVRKELRLHVIPWLMACVMVGLWAVWLLMRSMEPSNARVNPEDVSMITVLAGLLGAIAFVGSGAATVAEERKLGTLDWQLTQPVPLRRQWWIKVAVAFALAIVLGVGVPGALVWMSFPAERLHSNFADVEPYAWAAYAAGFGLLLATSILASSICRSTMKATAATVGIGGGIVGAIALGAGSSQLAMQESAQRPMPEWAAHGRWDFTSDQAQTAVTLMVGAAVLVLGAGLLILARRNHRRSSVPTASIVRQVAWVVIGTCLLVRLVGGGFQVLMWLPRGPAEPAAVEGLPVSPSKAATAAVQGGLDPEPVRRYGLTTLPPTSAPAAPAAPVGMDPRLARRYGLKVLPPPTVVPPPNR